MKASIAERLSEHFVKMSYGGLPPATRHAVKRLALDKPGIRRTLAGFSAGGGFALRVASGRRHALFDDYLAISPFIVVDPDLLRSTTGYANIAARRIAALIVLAALATLAVLASGAFSAAGTSTASPRWNTAKHVAASKATFVKPASPRWN